MKLARSLLEPLLRRPGFFSLVFLLILITVASFKPDFHLMGWDNYSSYFEPGINIFRTFFATWREYRGLGVASDAEVTDMFRQLWYLPMRIILPEALLDQAYYLFALWAGVLSMYAFGKLVARGIHVRGHLLSEKQLDLFAAITAFLYLFNLNTLSIFYSPIIPFTNRFYALPLTLYAFVRFLGSKRKRMSFFMLALLVILTSGSYVTPTIFITTIIALFIYGVSKVGPKKAVLYCVVYGVLNAFWILPFLNYTIQKSSIVPLARTFIEINESTLNKPETEFSLEKQSILYPSFFDLQFRTLKNQTFPIHPDFDLYTTRSERIFLYVFPLLYIAGSLLLIFQWKKHKQLLWIPVWIVLFLFLSTKSASPVGFIYTWLEETIPLFGILFRISDTKFHAYISVAGSIASAYLLLYLLLHIKRSSLRRLVLVPAIALAVGYMLLFRGYFTGDLIGFFAYARLPDAYKEIANTINATPGHGRVLHLPMDVWYSYWRSYSWGYVGSSFFHNLINKPYIDKTFEPASMENAYLHSKLTNLIDAYYRSNDISVRENRADEFVRLLSDAGIQYVMLDQSVTSSMYARNMTFDAKQWYVQARDILEEASLREGVVKKQTFTIPLEELYPFYASVYPTRDAGSALGAPSQSTITLYEVGQVRSMASAQPSVINTDPYIDNLMEFYTRPRSLVVQDRTRESQLMPLRRQNQVVESSQDTITLTATNPNATKTITYEINSDAASSESFVVDIHGKRVGNELTLTFFHKYYPDINGTRFEGEIGTVTMTLPREQGVASTSGSVLGNWPEDDLGAIQDEYRLVVGGSVVPVPARLGSQEEYISSVMVHSATIDVGLLVKQGTETIPLESIRETQPLSCFGPPAGDYDGALVTSFGDQIRLMAKSGSSCGSVETHIASVPNGEVVYGELGFRVRGDEAGVLNGQGYTCVREQGIDECLNTHRTFRIFPESHVYRFPLTSMSSGVISYPLDIGLVNFDEEELNIVIEDIVYHFYAQTQEETLTFVPVKAESTVTLEGDVIISLPKAISPYSYLQHPGTDGFYVPIDGCKGDLSRPRTIGFTADLTNITMDNCSTHLAQWFHYATDKPYLFSYEYARISGQQPSIVIGRNGDNYFFERSSIYQGYPNIAKGSSLIKASRLIDPLFTTDSLPATTAIHLFQDTANKGGLSVRSFDMIELPQSWVSMTLTPQASLIQAEGLEQDLKTTRVFPSLWKVEGVTKNSILLFNQGFDAQWGIYDSVWSVLFGNSLARSVRCDGFANCFVLSGSGNQSNIRYIFYWPERLAIAGWIITLGILIVPLGMILRTKLAKVLTR